MKYLKKIEVNNLMQKGYIYYLTESVGDNFDDDFKPDLSPKEMLELGVFGGKYLNSAIDEYPSIWFENAKLSNSYDSSLNFFKVSASKPLSYWRQKEWIHPQDPRGWFEWYCRYYYGRRSDDDLRQIKRWKAIFRHVFQLKKNCTAGDWKCRPRQRQALLHWAVDSRKL